MTARETLRNEANMLDQRCRAMMESAPIAALSLAERATALRALADRIDAELKSAREKEDSTNYDAEVEGESELALLARLDADLSPSEEK